MRIFLSGMKRLNFYRWNRDLKCCSGRGVCVCVSGRGISLLTSLPCLQGICGRQKTKLLKCRRLSCPHGSLPHLSILHVLHFTLLTPISLLCSYWSDPFIDCWTLGEKQKSCSVYPHRGTLLAISYI